MSWTVRKVGGAGLVPLDCLEEADDGQLLDQGDERAAGQDDQELDVSHARVAPAVCEVGDEQHEDRGERDAPEEALPRSALVARHALPALSLLHAILAQGA